MEHGLIQKDGPGQTCPAGRAHQTARICGARFGLM